MNIKELPVYSFASYNENRDLKYQLVAPGRKKEDFEIEVLNGKLIVKGDEFCDKTKIPTDIDVKNIKASYDSGILEIFLPIKEEQKSRTIEIT